MRGAVPKGVTAPRGDTSVTESPTVTRSRLARRVPMAMPSCRSKPSRLPKRTLPAISGRALSPSSRTPRTKPATACCGVEAMAWPSIRGTACLTPGSAASSLATSS